MNKCLHILAKEIVSKWRMQKINTTIAFLIPAAGE